MATTTRKCTYYSRTALADEVGLHLWQFDHAMSAQMLPAPTHSRGWRPDQVDDVRALVPGIVARFGAERPVGTTRCADRLAKRLGINVDHSDIQALAVAGALEVAEVFKSDDGPTYDLFAPAAIDALTPEQVTAVLTARAQWTAPTVSSDDACAKLGWDWRELKQVVEQRGIPRERYGRLRREHVDGLAADVELCAQVRADRLVTADQACQKYMNVARRHFNIAVEGGLITPKDFWDKQYGYRKIVKVPLYRVGDVEALLAHPDIDWDVVRATPKGKRSPLLDIVKHRAASRGKLIRRFLRDFGAKHKIEMWGWYRSGPDQWELDWERVDGHPSQDDVAAAIEAHPALKRFRKQITLHSNVGAAIRFAREMLAPGRAVILDTETTDLYGAVCEIAVIDAATGATLLNTLVNPGVPIEPGAQAIHGITDAEVTAPGVPDWPTVYGDLLRITEGRIVLAYKADYEHKVVTADCVRYGITASPLAQPAHWADVMVKRSDHLRSPRYLPNGGGHRALGDVRQTREHLLGMTTP